MWNMSATLMKTVLLIDDDRAVQDVFSIWFGRHGWKVLQADDGDVGIKVALEQRPDVIICDLLMPRCNGFLVCRALREHRVRLPQLKIVVTTGSAYSTDRLAALEAGADEYIVKPVAPAALMAVLDRLISDVVTNPPLAAAPVSDGSAGSTRLKFWGVRGSIPSPGKDTAFYGGNTTCVEIRAGGDHVILDSGTGIRSLGISLEEEFRDRPLHTTLLLTHMHWDHIQGFPFFLPAYRTKNQIRVLGFQGTSRGLELALASQMENPYFPVNMRQMLGNIVVDELKDLSFFIGKIRVEAQLMNHPGICAGYRLFTADGSISFLPDVELFQRLRGGVRPQTSEAAKYAQDQDDKLVNFVANSDVLILDAQYDADEYERHVGWGHSCVEDSVALAIKAGVKKLFLFHHDPTHTDEKISRLVAHTREIAQKHGSPLIVEAAREGLEVILTHTDSMAPA